MDTSSCAQAVAPLLNINSNPCLCGGLFDSTQITLLLPPQNVSLIKPVTGLTGTCAPNALASPFSVVDGQWHHAALMLQPGNGRRRVFFSMVASLRPRMPTVHLAFRS